MLRVQVQKIEGQEQSKFNYFYTSFWFQRVAFAPGVKNLALSAAVKFPRGNTVYLLKANLSGWALSSGGLILNHYTNWKVGNSTPVGGGEIVKTVSAPPADMFLTNPSLMFRCDDGGHTVADYISPDGLGIPFNQMGGLEVYFNLCFSAATTGGEFVRSDCSILWAIESI